LGLPRLTVFLEDEEKPATAIVEKWSDTQARIWAANPIQHRFICSGDSSGRFTASYPARYDPCHVSLSLEFHSESEQRPDARAAAEPAERHRNQNGTEHC